MNWITAIHFILLLIPLGQSSGTENQYTRFGGLQEQEECGSEKRKQTRDVSRYGYLK